MKLSFKRAGIECLETLVDLRIEFVKDIHPEYGIDLLARIHKATINYFRELFDKNSYIGFLGMNSKDEIICTAGLLIYYLPPLHSESYRKIGHILNFYTNPHYRKKGCGLELMDFIKVTAKKEGIHRLVLNATKAGYGLYKKSHFIEPEDKGMILEL